MATSCRAVTWIRIPPTQLGVDTVEFTSPVQRASPFLHWHTINRVKGPICCSFLAYAFGMIWWLVDKWALDPSWMKQWSVALNVFARTSCIKATSLQIATACIVRAHSNLETKSPHCCFLICRVGLYWVMNGISRSLYSVQVIWFSGER